MEVAIGRPKQNRKGLGGKITGKKPSTGKRPWKKKPLVKKKEKKTFVCPVSTGKEGTNQKKTPGDPERPQEGRLIPAGPFPNGGGGKEKKRSRGELIDGGDKKKKGVAGLGGGPS